MGKLEGGIADARRRVSAVLDILRWVWCLNAAAMALGIHSGNYEMAAATGLTCLLGLAGSAVARGAERRLRVVERVGRRQESQQPPEPQIGRTAPDRGG